MSTPATSANDQSNSFTNENMQHNREPEIVDVTPVDNTSTHFGTGEYSKQEAKPVKPKSKFTFGKIFSVFIFLISIILIGSFMFAYSMISNSNNYLGSNDANGGDFFSQLGQIGSILNISKRSQLKGENEGRTNFLLIGKDATGAGLTDTLMIASYFYKDQKMTTVNIPRDFQYTDSYTGTGGKINALFTWANQVKPGNGEQYLAEFFGKEFGITIHYWASVSFQGVKDVVDTLGGVDVNVTEKLVDCRYPTDNYSGYISPCPSFEAGTQKMDGKKALIYARSRESTSDFDRSRRQSVVVQAILDKIKTQNVFENATKITTYLNIINKNFKTSLKLDEISALAQILKENPNIKDNYITNVWQTGNGFLCATGDATAYYNGYCDGALMGAAGASKSRDKAKNYIQNILQISVSGMLLDSKAVFLGNQSNDTEKVYNDFANLGFTNISLNNSYSKIKPATARSIETVKIYITDPKIKELFDKLEKKPTIKYDLLTAIPDDLIIPNNFRDAKIIVWVS